MSAIGCSTHLAILVKSIFTDQIRCPDTLVYPAGAVFHLLGFRMQHQCCTFPISSASLQRLLPFFLSSSKACSTLVGISIQYLCVVFLILFLSAAKMTCLFFRVWGPTIQMQVPCQYLWTLHMQQLQLDVIPSYLPV